MAYRNVGAGILTASIRELNLTAHFEIRFDDFLISTDPALLDYQFVHEFLTASYWAKGITAERVRRSLEHSLCFGLFHRKSQVGFARVVTDYARFAYLADVFVVEDYRGLGLSKTLLTAVMEHRDLQNLTRWLLVTRDAHGLYEKFGFERISRPEMFMEMLNPPEA